MREPAQLAKCLRCISSTGETAQPCPYAECVYDCAEPVTEETKKFEALAEDGGCFHSIDCASISLDAAELIEKLRRENKQFRAAFDKAATESAYFKAAFVKACEANDDLFKKLTAMKAERDAAVADLAEEKDCRFCKYYEEFIRMGMYCGRAECDYFENNKWEWRGAE